MMGAVSVTDHSAEKEICLFLTIVVFCLCRLGWWTTEGANHHSSCLGSSCWSCHTLRYWVFWQCPEATVEGYQTAQGKGEIKDLSCFLVRNAITVLFHPYILTPNSLSKWWFFWTSSWKRPQVVVWLLQETTSCKQPVTLHILGASFWEVECMFSAISKTFKSQ